MQDRGEKIVTLAREILRADTVPEASPTHISMSFKVLCFATVLAAVGGSTITAITIENQRPIDRYERTEISALIFYAANQKGLSEAAIRAQMLTALKLPSVEAMTEKDFVAARDYLRDKAT